MGLCCTVGGNYLFSCDFNFPKSSFSLVLHQAVQFHAVKTDGIAKKKNMENFKRNKQFSGFMVCIFAELLSAASCISSVLSKATILLHSKIHAKVYILGILMKEGCTVEGIN